MNFQINVSYQLLRDYGGENWSLFKYLEKYFTFSQYEAMISPLLAPSSLWVKSLITSFADIFSSSNGHWTEILPEYQRFPLKK